MVRPETWKEVEHQFYEILVERMDEPEDKLLAHLRHRFKSLVEDDPKPLLALLEVPQPPTGVSLAVGRDLWCSSTRELRSEGGSQAGLDKMVEYLWGHLSQADRDAPFRRRMQKPTRPGIGERGFVWEATLHRGM